jgi:Ca2+-binding EF-hand superfamily protein
MHPGQELSCVDCHGGNNTTRNKFESHVQPSRQRPDDERVAGETEDLRWRRFVNPMDLRIVDRTCGGCHPDEVSKLESSLHGTTAGHLSDGYYEMGLLKKKGSRFSIFSVSGIGIEEGEVEKLVQIPGFRTDRDEELLGTHFADLARKECMQCHLYSQGRAVRGRVGFDGDYRGEGCAACHVSYATDGLSDSADRKALRTEPGHPLRHTMTRAPTTDTCVSCHYGDASIGLNFRGLSQLPPGAPGGPDIPGTTNTPLNRTFYIEDGEMTPPDVHHERGMHCIDCHTLSDVMGDGELHGQMEYGVEISCEGCHGSFDREASLRTERGAAIENVRREGDEVWLTSKVTGARHPVTQVKHLVDPTHAKYKPAAARAMTGDHAKLECYACHAGWNPNFLGFHFDRNESFTQLDLISGKQTPGRVTTQEKVFSTWKSFYAGWNEAGRIAPYMTGFSTMGSVSNKEGERFIDQEMPVTAAGLSGMTMIHHQTHTVRPTSRSCVECHRSPATWGMGSENFRLARQLAFVADERGIEVVALNRAALANSVPLAKVILPDVTAIEILADGLQGFAQYLYAAEGGRGVHTIDVRDPAHPRRTDFEASAGPKDLAVAGDHLYVADGIGGLRIYSLEDPAEIELVSVVPMYDASAVHVQWPWAYVADGPGGLVIVDIRAPIAPRVISATKLNVNPIIIDAAIDLDLIFQYSRPLPRDSNRMADEDTRTEARNIAAVIDLERGLFLVDVTEPSAPEVIFPRSRGRSQRAGNRIYRGIEVISHVDLAEAQGGTRTRERDYAYLLTERIRADGDSTSSLAVLDISDPMRPETVGTVRAGDATEMLTLASFYNTPFLQTVLFYPNDEGVGTIDVSISSEPVELASLPGIRGAYVIAVEEFPLDAMRSPNGSALKDVSHPESRWLYLSEIERVLSVSAEELGYEEGGIDEGPGMTARMHFARVDKDRNGWIDGKELSGALETADENSDGRVTLAELAQFAGVFETGFSEAAGPESVFLQTRVDEDGDITRLLDGIDPYAFDTDDDFALDREETESAFFAALDLDGDGRVTRSELSRYPGNRRRMRYGGAGAEEMFAKEEQARDGSLSRREFILLDEEWIAIDLDRSGEVALRRPVTRRELREGMVPAPPEWPLRREIVYPLPPGTTSEQLLAFWDADGDGAISRREAKFGEELWRVLDPDDSGSLSRYEIDRITGRTVRFGVDVCADSFEDRWDWDGDGRVEEDELELPLWIERRILGGR